MVDYGPTERVDVQQIELFQMISPAHGGLERRSSQDAKHSSWEPVSLPLLAAKASIFQTAIVMSLSDSGAASWRPLE